MRNADQAPTYGKTAFNCPHCGAFAHQRWHSLVAEAVHKNEPPASRVRSLRQIAHNKDQNLSIFPESPKLADEMQELGIALPINYLFACVCQHCSGISIWNDWVMIFPGHMAGPNPSSDLPEDLLPDFTEARSVLRASPRSAAAICRIMLEKLLGILKIEGKDLYNKIDTLKRQGIATEVGRSLDLVRIYGNNGAHPGQIQVSDDFETSVILLSLINYLVEKLITLPKSAHALYVNIPEQKRAALEGKLEKDA